MTNNEDIRTALDKLVTLGTPDAIALELEAQGIQAEPGRMRSCAIARYLGNTGPWLAMRGNPVTVSSSFVRHDDEVDAVRTPEVISDFIRKFDDGYYPALIAPIQEAP